MRAIKWHFDMMPEEIYDGQTDDTRWNGFLNVWITPEVRDVIADKYRATNDDAVVEDLMSIPVENGLVSLAHGYATLEVG